MSTIRSAFIRNPLSAAIVGLALYCNVMPSSAQGDVSPQSVQGAVTQKEATGEPKPAPTAKARPAERATKNRTAKAATDRKTLRSKNEKSKPAVPAGGAPSADKPPAAGAATAALAEIGEPAPKSRPALVVDGASVAQATETPKPAEIEVRVSASQQRENAYRSAVNALNDGRTDEAGKQLRQILAEHPGHDNARQALIGLALKQRQFAQAEALADERLEHGAEHLGFAVVSARLKLDRSDLAAALDVLKRSDIHARNNAEYQALTAAVLQRLSRHAEAAERFRAALALQPTSGVWSMGLGVSLQALERSSEAAEAFKRAREAQNLSPELRAFVDQRMVELRR